MKLVQTVYELYAERYSKNGRDWFDRFYTVSLMMDSAYSEGIISAKEWMEWERFVTSNPGTEKKINQNIRQFGRVS